MRIKTLDVVGFGHFSNQVFYLDEESQLIYGENEAGKSTLYQFVRAILFGFAKKREKMRDFEPRNGDAFGGSIVFHDDVYGDVKVARFKNKNRGEAVVTLENGEVGNDYLLEKIISPLTKDVFDQIFSFQQEQLIDLADLDEAKLQHLLLTVGLTGSEQLNDVSQKFLKERQQIYKPSGRVPSLNQQLHKLQQLEEKINQAENEEINYQAYLAERQTLQNQLDELKQQQAELDLKQKRYTQQQKRYTQYAEWAKLNQLLEKDTIVTDEVLKETQETFQEYRFLENKEKKLLEQHRELASLNSPAFQFYVDEQRELESIQAKQLDVERLTQQIKVKKQLLQSNVEQQSNLLKMHELKSIETSKEDLEKVVASIKTLSEEEEELVREKIVLDNEISRVALRRKEIDRELTLLERELKTQEKIMERMQMKQSNSLNIPFAIIGVAFALAIVAGISSVTWLFLVVAVLVALGGGLLWRTTKEQQRQKAHPQLDFSQHKQEYSMQLAASDEIEGEYAHLQNEKKSLETKLGVINEQKDTWSKVYGLNPKESLSNWLTKLPAYYQIMALKEKHGQLREEMKILKEEEVVFQEALLFAKEWLPLQGKTTQEGYELLTQFMKEQQKVREETQYMEQEQASVPLQLTRVRQDLTQLETHLLGLTNQSFFRSDDIVRFIDGQTEKRQEEEELKNLTLRLEDYFSLDRPYQLSDINQQLIQVNEESERILSEQEEAQARIQKLSFDIAQLEQNGILDDLYQTRANEVTVIRQLADEWLGYKLAEDTLQAVFDYLSEQQLPAVLKMTSEYFNIFTAGRYPQVVLKDGRLQVQDKKYQYWDMTQLSTGTKDQLYIAFRLGFIQLHSEDYDAPIIIDDGWLHFDSGRKEIFFNVMIALGKNRQIICLSSDEEMKSYFEKNGVGVIQLEGRK